MTPGFPWIVQSAVFRPAPQPPRSSPTGLSPSLEPHFSGLRLNGVGPLPLEAAGTGLRHHISRPSSERDSVWALPFLLAVTQGISNALRRADRGFPRGSCAEARCLLISLPAPTGMFRFGAFPFLAERRPKPSGFRFGHLRFEGTVRLPGAFRRWARPSSALEPSHPPEGLEI